MSSARDAALEIASRLRAAGHLAYFAGGCVRDRLRGEDPKDYDVATDATPSRVQELFPRAIGVGEAFGVMLVRRGGHAVEVATFRSDGAYSDRRRPDAVSFGSPREDAMRRDFTINGLFENPHSGEVIDFVGGQADLRAGVVRAIGDPMARLDEDRLRMLRAVRFAARFGFVVDPATRRAIEAAGTLRGVSRERVGQELRRMFADRSRVEAAAMLEAMALDAEVLHEPSQRSALLRLRSLEAGASIEAAMAAWLLDRIASAQDAGTAITGPGRAPSTPSARKEAPRCDREPHAEVAELRAGDAARGGRGHRPPRLASQRRADGWTAALVLSNDEAARIAAILEHAEALGVVGHTVAARTATWLGCGTAIRKRRASAPGFDDALEMLAAIDPAAASTIRTDVRALADSAGGLAPAPLVGGDDLVQRLGLAPGPRFKALLHEAYDAQLEGRLRSIDEALEFVRERASR